MVLTTLPREALQADRWLDRQRRATLDRQAPRHYDHRKTTRLEQGDSDSDIRLMSEESFPSSGFDRDSSPSPTPSVRSLSSDAVDSKPFSFVPRSYSEASMRSLSPEDSTSPSLSESSPKRLAESYSDSRAEEYLPEQQLIHSPNFKLRIKDTRQAYLKEIVNAEIRSNANRKGPAFTRGGLSPREVYLRRTLNAELKQMGWKKEIHRAIEQRGRSMFFKKCAVEEIKQITRKDRLMRDIRDRFQAAEDKAKVLDSIHARRALMRYFERTPRVLEKRASHHIISRMKRCPKQTYWKFISQQDCVDEVHLREEQAEEEELLTSESECESVVFHHETIEEDLAHHFQKREIHRQILLRGRQIARRRQISQMLEHKENKRLVLKELKQRALNKEVRRLKRRRGEVILAMHDMAVEAKRQRNNDDNISLSGIENRLGQVIHDELTQSLIKGVSRGIRSGVERITRRRAKSVEAHFIQNQYMAPPTLAVHDKQAPTVVPHSETTQNWFRQHYLRMEVNRQIRNMSPGHSPIPEHMNVSDWTTSTDYLDRSELEAREPALPGPKEFFVRTIVNHLLSKRPGRPSRKMFLLARHIAMPEQAYLKLKVNEVIKKIGLVKERQAIRAQKRLINQEIVNRGNKAAVNRHILFLARAIQTKMGIFEPEIELPPALDMDVFSEMEDQCGPPTPMTATSRAQHTALVDQVHTEIKQRQLKKNVLMEIKVAGLKNRVCHEIRRLAMQKELNMLRQRRGEILLQMGNIRSVNTRMSSKALLNSGQPLSKQLYLKQQVNQAVLQRGKQQQLKQLVHETIVQRSRKAAVCKEIKTRQRQIELKGEVAQIIQARGDKMRLMNELRRWSLKRRLARAAGVAQQTFVPPRTTKEECAQQAIRRIKTQLIDAKRRKETLRKVAKAFSQIGHARKCRKQINQIITTHRRMGEVVLEIKTRGQTVRNKDRLLEELEEWHAEQASRAEDEAFSKKIQMWALHYDLQRHFYEKKKKNWSWREQNRRLHADLFEYFEQKEEAARRERDEARRARRPIDRYQHMPVARQMFLKMEVNRHFKQRGLKMEMHRELLTRFRVVDLKQKICDEVIQHARMQLWRRQVQMTINQRALKAQVVADIFTGRVPTLHPPRPLRDVAEVSFEGMFNPVVKDEYSVVKRTRMLKFEVVQEIEEMRSQGRFLTNKPSTSMVAELAKINKDQIIRKREMLNELRSKQMERQMLKLLEERAEHKRRKTNIDQVLRQRELKARLNRDIRQRQQAYLNKQQMLQELRMVKLKMMVGREIKQIGYWKQKKREVVQTIQMRGDHARTMWMIRNQKHWMLNPKTRYQRVRQAHLKARLVEQIRVMGHRMRVVEEVRLRGQQMRRRKQIDMIMAQSQLKEACLKELTSISEPIDSLDWQTVEDEAEFVPTEWGALEEAVLARKSLVNEAIRQRAAREKVSKMLALRAKVVRLKAKLNMELKVRVNKAKCVYAIWERAQARKYHRMVCEELLQRTRLSRCVYDIQNGMYYLRKVAKPVEFSAVTIIKQQLHKKRVNTVVRQAGLKIELNQELLDRQATCNRKHRVTEEIKLRARKVKLCRQVRRRAHHTLRSHIEEWAETNKNYRMCVDEFQQRCRHLQVVNEIKVRQKQVHWKAQTCIVIKQGGNKIRVNKEIRSIARQKFLKKQINTLIKQGGLKSRVQKEIRQLRMIADIQRQKQLKSKVNLAIKQIAEAKINKRRVNCVVKQTGLKARCNQQIRSRQFSLKRVQHPQLTNKIADYISSPFTISRYENPPALYSQQAVLAHPELARPAIDPSKRRRRHRSDSYLDDMEEAWSMLGSKLEESSRAEGQEDAGVVVNYPEHENAFGYEYPQLFDDLECVYGETFSEKGLAVMKLVESVTKVSERKEKQEKQIRSMSAEINQQKSDFEKFSTRMVEDKAKLYSELEKLKAENARLRQLKQDQENEKRRKLIQQAQERAERKQTQKGPTSTLKRMGSLVGNKLAEKLHIRVQETQHQQSARPMQEPIACKQSQATQFQMVELNNGKRVHHYPQYGQMQMHQQNRQLFF